MTRLIDSVILIDHFNGVPQATEYLAHTHGEIALSVITRAEVLTGFRPVGEPKALLLLDALPTLDITIPVADLAARLRREHRWKMPDALQAAVAVHHGLKLVTRNTRDFSPARHDFVEIPYQI